MSVNDIQSIKGTMTLEFENAPLLWALVKGGRILPPLVSPWQFLLDSNAVTLLKNRSKMLSPEKEWWKSLLGSRDTVLNPVPNAFEGNTGLRPPTREEFEKRFNEDVKMLRDEFPNITVIEYDKRAFDGVYSMVIEIAGLNERENKFLLESAAFVADPVKEVNRRSVETSLLEIAARLGIKSDSFALYSVLSCLYSAGAKIQIAREVLKPFEIISKNNAYNALTDFSLLRLLTAMIAFFKTSDWPPFALLTADRNLIKFWCALQVDRFNVTEDGVAVAIFSFSEPMFPTLNDDGRSELSKRVGSL